MPAADNLTPAIWNAIADQIERSNTLHEIVFGLVTKVDKTRKLIWVEGFGDMALPLVGFNYSFSYFDTLNNGSLVWRGDKTQTNPAYRVEVVMPDVGDVAIVLDLGGAKTYPICIGISLSHQGFWESE